MNGAMRPLGGVGEVGIQGAPAQRRQTDPVTWRRRRADCDENRVVVFGPRLARIFHHPAVAVALGVILIVVGVIGLVSGDIATGFAILILVVGTIHVLRDALPGKSQPPD
jgi:hypothetical protein